MFHTKRLSAALEQIAQEHHIQFTPSDLLSATVLYKLRYAGMIGIKKIRRRLRKQVHVIGPVAVLHGDA